MDNKNRKDVLAKALEGVDREHDMIFEILDKIKYSFTNDLSAGLKKSLIKELYLFLDFHFTSEENLLVMFDCPDGGRHKKEHHYDFHYFHKGSLNEKRPLGFPKSLSLKHQNHHPLVIFL